MLIDADWDGEYVWLEATVIDYNPTTTKHTVRYVVDGLVKEEQLIGTPNFKWASPWRFSERVSYAYADATPLPLEDAVVPITDNNPVADYNSVPLWHVVAKKLPRKKSKGSRAMKVVRVGHQGVHGQQGPCKICKQRVCRHERNGPCKVCKQRICRQGRSCVLFG